MSDPIQHALDQVHCLGLLVEHLETDGKLRRVDVDGAKRGKKAGWYVAHLLRLDNGEEVVVGAYGIWQGAENNVHKFTIKRGAGGLNEAEKAKLKEQQKRAREAQERARQELANEAAARAKEIWSKLAQLGRSPYLDRKKVRAHGLRFGRDGAIVVPVQNSAGMLVGLQFIAADGSKKFLTGTAKAGGFHLIGTIVDEAPLVFAEGYATAASIFEATGWPVVVCFDCGNLMLVATAMRLAYPSARVIFAGDDDHQRSDNPGRHHATQAALRHHAKAVFPRFEDPAGRTDFNDLHAEQGLDAVRAQVLAAWTPTVRAGAGADDELWTRQLVLGRDGLLKPIENNVILVLEHHPAWKGVFAYNQFAKRIVKLKAPPFDRGAEGWLRDIDEIECGAWFGRRDTFAVGVSQDVARRAILAVAERHAFHPLRDYLGSLKWDGEPRLETFFSDFCGVEQNAVHAAFGKAFFIQAVARIFKPGCKARLMLVLEGPQWKGKSTLAETLAGPGYYVDVGTPPTDKDFYQIIQGVWIVEISEMASFAKAENAHIKRVISVAVDRFRKSYGHNVEDFPRECVFFGTVNRDDWQRDETGGTRYMPIWVNDIDHEAVRAVRDQVWAEAVHRFQLGEPWHVLPDEAREVQEARFQDDIWAQAVIRWLNGKGDANSYREGFAAPVEKTTTAEILNRALGVELKKQDRAAQTRIGNLMQRLGWRKTYERTGNVRVYVYHRPPEDKA